MKRLSEKLIQKARDINLKPFLEKHGYTFKRCGKDYRSNERSSLLVNESGFQYYAESDSGNALDFVIRHMGYDFRSAVLLLTNETLSDLEEPVHINENTSSTTFITSSNQKDFQRIYAYLIKKRHINKNTVSLFFRHNLIKPLIISGSTNIGFIVENGGFEYTGITDKKFKGITSNVIRGNAFVFRRGTPNHLYFFESAIDLMSFYDINYKNISDSWLISMAGVRKYIIDHYHNLFPNAQVIISCDNDAAGRKLIETITFNHQVLLPQKKDWNEDLQSLNNTSM